jgi:hypothetical protein
LLNEEVFGLRVYGANSDSKLKGMALTSINPLTQELNPSAQRCLTRFLTGDFTS